MSSVGVGKAAAEDAVDFQLIDVVADIAAHLRLVDIAISLEWRHDRCPNPAHVLTGVLLGLTLLVTHGDSSVIRVRAGGHPVRRQLRGALDPNHLVEVILALLV